MDQYQIINQNLNDLAKVGVEAVVIRTFYPPLGSDHSQYGNQITAKDKDTPLYQSSLNTPVFSDLDTQGGTYSDNDGNKLSFPALKFDTVLFIVNQSKGIVTTSVNGRNGSIKEYISDDDYQITIQGTIAGGNGIYPKNEVAAFKKVLDAPVAIQVNSWYLNQFGIHSIVIKDYTLPQQAGRNSQQEFNISCISDVPVILQLR